MTVQTSQEVGLVFHGVGRGFHPQRVVGRVAYHTGIVTGGDAVVGKTALLLESTKFDKAVAHHVGIGREATARTVCHISQNTVGIGLLKVNHLKTKAVAARRDDGKLDVFFGRAAQVFSLKANLDVKDVGAHTLLAEQMERQRTVDTAREQKGGAQTWVVVGAISLWRKRCEVGFHIEIAAVVVSARAGNGRKPQLLIECHRGFECRVGFKIEPLHANGSGIVHQRQPEPPAVALTL